jgi:hypothetical protein
MDPKGILANCLLPPRTASHLLLPSSPPPLPPLPPAPIVALTTCPHLPGAESAFEVPLNDVTQANAQKSDAVVEMADDDTALPEDEMLVELRLHVAATGDDGGVDEAGAESFVAAIKESGDLEAAGSTLCDFPDVPIQVPHLPTTSSPPPTASRYLPPPPTISTPPPPPPPLPPPPATSRHLPPPPAACRCRAAGTTSSSSIST